MIISGTVQITSSSVVEWCHSGSYSASGVALAVFPGKEQRECDHRHDDDEHQQGGGNDHLALLGGNVTSRVQDNGLAATGQAGCQCDRCQPGGPAEFWVFNMRRARQRRV